MAEREGGLSAAERAGERAAKNTTVRAAGEIVGKLATFVLFAVLARAVGPADVGIYVFAFAFLQIAMVPIALGSDSYLLRQVAKNRASIDDLFTNVLALKLALAVPVLTAALLLVSLLGYDMEARATVYVLTAGLLFDLLAKSFHSVFNAVERSDLLTATVVAQRVVAALLGIAVLAAGYGVVVVSATYTLGAAVHLGLAVFLMQRSLGLPRVSVTWRRWRSLATTSFPFAVQDVFTVLLFRLDAVLLSLLAAEAAVGRYGAAYRLLDSTLFVSWALNGAFAAMYAYLGPDTEPTVQSVFQRSVKLALVVLVPAAVAFGVLAEPLCRLLFGAAFEDAGDPLRLLAPVVVLLCVVTLSTSLIISRRSPRTMLPVTAAMVAVNVGLNLLLIPLHADSGAAAAMLVTEAVFAVVVMRLAAKSVGGIDWTSMLASPLLAGAAMTASMLLLRGSFAAAFAVGAAVYVVAFVLVERRLCPKDFRFVEDMLKRQLRSRFVT